MDPNVSQDLVVAVQSGDWVTVVLLVLGVVWTLLGVTRRIEQWRLSKLAAVETAQTQAERTRNALLARVSEMARGAVTEVYTEYVRARKAAAADGKLTPEEKQEAQSAALEKLMAAGKEAGVDLAKEFGTPFLKSLLESAVSWAKARGKAATTT